jgi:hypothetical protein
MKVEILRQTVAGGHHLGVGSIVDLPTTEAKLLVNLNKARLVSDAVITREPEVVHREPEMVSEPARKPRKPKLT